MCTIKTMKKRVAEKERESDAYVRRRELESERELSYKVSLYEKELQAKERDLSYKVSLYEKQRREIAYQKELLEMGRALHQEAKRIEDEMVAAAVGEILSHNI